MAGIAKGKERSNRWWRSVGRCELLVPILRLIIWKRREGDSFRSLDILTIDIFLKNCASEKEKEKLIGKNFVNKTPT